MKLRFATLVFAAGLVLCAAGRAAAESAESRLEKLGDEFIDGWFTRRPHLATPMGMHGWDSRLVPVTEGSVVSDLRWLAGIRARLDQIPRTELSFERAQERDLLLARIERERIELEDVRSWERDPSFYVDIVAGSVQSVLARDFTSPCERVVLATRRLRLVPEVMRAARVNLRHPPRFLIEAAIDRYTDALEFLRGGILPLTENCREPLLHADLAQADSQAVGEIVRFIEELRAVLPRAPEAFTLGRDLLQRRLAAAELDDIPVDSLLAAGWQALAETQERMTAVAARIAPGQGVAPALESLRRAPDDAIATAVGSQLDTLRTFLRARALVSAPSEDNLKVRAMPVGVRERPLVALDAPGVWEKRAQQAWLDVALPQAGANADVSASHRARLNRTAIRLAAIHEALPGRYWQRLATQSVPSHIRQVLPYAAGAAGWADYCEQMMVEEGVGGGDPGFELAQLERSLVRIGRLIATLSIHVDQMSVADAARMLEERCYRTQAEAEREAQRAALEPDGLAETLGRWRILALRDEAQRMLGPAFRLREFHDVLLRQGPVPLALAREGVLRELGRRHRIAVGEDK